MGVFTKLTKTKIKDLLRQFPEVPTKDFKHSGVGMGTVNTYYKIKFSSPKETYFLKIDEVADEPRLKNEITVFNTLEKHKNKLSYKTPTPLKAIKQKNYIPFRSKFVLIFPEVSGKSIYRGLTSKHLKAMGSCLAELHKLPLSKNIKGHRFNLAGLQKSYNGIKTKLDKKHPDIKSAMDLVFKDLKKNQSKSDVQKLIHGDLFPENVHWTKGNLTGLIDFEAAGKGSPLFDICVGIHALCFTRNKPDSNKIKAFLTGYQSITPISQKQLKRIPYYLQLTTIRFLLTRLKDFELPGRGKDLECFKNYTEFWNRLKSHDGIVHTVINQF